YAALFEGGVAGLELISLPGSHASGGPVYLNVLRYLDLPVAVAMAAERIPLRLRGVDPEDWGYARDIAEQFEWAGRIGFAGE
ncbi:MAG: hypothetical protein ACR2RV_24890, partial [Verrucomicrobiales bacterium]